MSQIGIWALKGWRCIMVSSTGHGKSLCLEQTGVAALQCSSFPIVWALCLVILKLHFFEWCKALWTFSGHSFLSAAHFLGCCCWWPLLQVTQVLQHQVSRPWMLLDSQTKPMYDYVPQCRDTTCEVHLWETHQIFTSAFSLFKST